MLGNTIKQEKCTTTGYHNNTGKNALILRTSADILENAVILEICTATGKHNNTGKKCTDTENIC